MRIGIAAAFFAAITWQPGASAQDGPDLEQAIAGDYPYLQELFEHLHANPELSMQEHKSSDRIAAELEAAGFEITRGIGTTGLVGKMQNGDGPMLMIRADMDALPVEEKTNLSYASQARQVNLEGVEMPVMHACGHDMHMTTLVGVARLMAALKDQWRGTLMLVAQPAEEALGGALAMVADGLYERVGKPDFALALHVSAGVPSGSIIMSEGFAYSSADTVKILVHGVATHGASPHLGRDPIVIASQIVLNLQTIITREVSPIEPALITVGAFHAGTAPNVIPDHAVLQITVRANNEETRELLLDSIERVAVNTARTAGIAEEFLPEVTVADDGASPTINDTPLAHRVRAAIAAGMGEDVFIEFKQSDMGAEDFPDLVKTDPPIPSVYFEVGGTKQADLDSGDWAGHHSPLFRIDPEGSVTAGVEAMTLAALDLLAPQ